MKLPVQAQVAISGIVKDEKNNALPGAAVELRSSQDSSLTKVNVTDINGEFTFMNIKPADYFLKISMLGFASFKSPVFNFDGVTEKKFSSLQLSPATHTLKEANVSGIKPIVEIKSDKTVFNVENSINSTGSTAYELLQKAPGVVVDNNDNIMLKGRGGVLVQIDGKDTHFTQQELADYLKTLQSTDVASIELISNPSSKYEAEGTAGIINIRLKKNKSYGTNGSVTLGYAAANYSKFNTALSLNHRSKKWNIFSQYSNNWGDRLMEFYLYREQDPYIFNASSFFRRWGLNHNYKGGADYTVNTKNTIGIMVSGNFNNINGTTTNRNIISDFENNSVDSILMSDQSLKGHSQTFSVNANHHYSDSAGHELSTDFDASIYDASKNNFQPNIYTLPDYKTLLSAAYYRSVTPTTIHIYTLKTDYAQNLLKGKFSGGYKLSFVNTDNTFNFYSVNGTQEVIDNNRSNHFVYEENILSAYINYQRTIGKFDLQAGLRVENTSSEGDLKSAADTMQNKNVKRKYTDLFPSGGLTYTVDQNNSLALIYSRRIDRPNYQDLNPFEMKLDELSYMKGNPFLDPQYSDKLELSNTYKYTTTASIGYSRTKDFFAQITDTIPGGKSYLTSRNLAQEEIFSLDLSSSKQLFSWYNIYFHTGLYNQKYLADFDNGKIIDASVTYFNFFGQNTIKLPLNYTLEISGWYNSSGIWGGSYVTKPQGSLDLGLQKKLFNEQATLKISYSDIFNTAPWNSHNVYGGIVIRANGTWESRQFRASFNWRFGNNQVKNVKQRTTGSESERKRIGGGD